MSETGEEKLVNPELDLKAYDVVVVLGGNIRKTKSRGYVTTSFAEGPEKSIGAHSRTLAAAELYKKGKSKKFIVCTGKTVTIPGDPNTPDPNAPSEAEIMKKEMTRYGVPEDAIIVEDRSTTTFQNAQEAAKIIREKDYKNIGLLTSFWHLERAKVMFDAQGLGVEGRIIIPIASEDIILERYSTRHKARAQAIVEAMTNAKTTKERLKSEAQGVEDFKSGRYKPKPLQWNPNDEKKT